MNCKLIYLLGLTLLYINVINAKSINTNNEDKYYLIYVNNDKGEYKIYSDSKNQKRQESQLFIESLVEDISNLITNNKDTYQNPEKLLEIEEGAHLNKRKRNIENNNSDSNGDSELVYPISSIDNRVVLLAYLSKKLSEEIPLKYNSVIDCIPDKYSFTYFHKNYNVDDILAETHWKNLTVRENADFHLSLLSQGIYDKNIAEEYDKNYYYPSSAGKDVDIVFLDSSFNFDYSEFSNTDDRIVKCVGIINNGKVSSDFDENGCAVSTIYHGETVTVTAAGLTHGVANRANVYGVSLPPSTDGSINDSDILAGVQYIYENMIRSHRTVVNLSLGGFEEEHSEYYKQFNLLVDGITEKGGIVVAAAGNEYRNLDTSESPLIPCEFENVICVGGTDNRNYKQIETAYQLVRFSNFGKNVTVYAPSHVKVEIVKNSKVQWINNDGTSFSTPIVSGLIANIISENDEISHTKETITQQLYENGKDEIIKLRDGSTGIIANNGKHSLYSDDVVVIPPSSFKCKSESLDLGFPCCKGCYTVYVDENGEWGIEDNEWCSIKFSCNDGNQNNDEDEINTEAVEADVENEI